MTPLPLLRVFRRMVDSLRSSEVPFAILGGFAVRVWGLPRPTYDLDLTVGIGRDDVVRFLDGLRRSGFEVPEEHATGFLDRLAGMDKVTVHCGEGGHSWDVDVFLATTPFLRSAMRRARVAEVARRRVSVLAPEDVILLKLVAARPRDFVDIQEVMLVVGRLDLARMRRWAPRLGVEKRLVRALREAGRA